MAAYTTGTVVNPYGNYGPGGSLMGTPDRQQPYAQALMNGVAPTALASSLPMQGMNNGALGADPTSPTGPNMGAADLMQPTQTQPMQAMPVMPGNAPALPSPRLNSFMPLPSDLAAGAIQRPRTAPGMIGNNPPVNNTLGGWGGWR